MQLSNWNRNRKVSLLVYALFSCLSLINAQTMLDVIRGLDSLQIAGQQHLVRPWLEDQLLPDSDRLSESEVLLCYIATAFLSEDIGQVDSLISMIVPEDISSPTHYLQHLARQSQWKGLHLQADSLWQYKRHSPDSDTALWHLSYVENLISLRRYDQAGSYVDSLMARFKPGTHPVLVARWKETRALLASFQDQIALADSLFSELEVYWEEGNDHPWRDRYVLHRALHLTYMGVFDQAEVMLLSLIQNKDHDRWISKRIQADACSNLGELYRLLGDYDNAIRYYQDARRIYKAMAMHAEQATVLNNLALAFDQLDSLEMAETYYLEAIDFYKSHFGRSDLTYALIVNNLAGLLEYREQYEDARDLYEEVLQVFDLLGETDTNLYATILSNVALLSEAQGEAKLAERLLTKALSIRKDLLGTEHPTYVELLYNMAGLLSDVNPERAIEYYLEANGKQLNLMHDYYATFDEHTRIYYAEQMQVEFERFYALALESTRRWDLRIEVLDFSMAIKGLALSYHMNQRNLLAEESDQYPVYQKWLTYRDSLASSLVKSRDDLSRQKIDLAQLRYEVNLLEKQWSRSIDFHTTRTDFDQLRASLRQDEAAVDFVRFEGYNNGHWTDTIYYYALVILPDESYPIAVPAGTEEQILECFAGNFNPVVDEATSRKLYHLLWNSIQTYLSECRKIKISPVGVLHKVPFSGLLSASGEYLREMMQIQYYGNLSDAVTTHSSELKNDPLLLLGGVNYDAELNGCPLPSAGSFSDLPGSEIEIEEVASLARNRGYNVDVLVGARASESDFVDVLNRGEYGIVHLSTHGYFYNQVRSDGYADLSLRNKILTSENVLLRSGLALAGVNRTWNIPVQSDQKQDGVLTALEVSSMDMRSTDLVVLSACATGLGDVHHLEGVFGLQRAFRMAGVESVLYTLWDVPDRSSSSFMQYFYRFLFRSMDPQLALFKAQKKMASKYDPFHWAGFVLMN